MITDKDIQKLTKVLATKKDLSEMASDIVRIEELAEKADQRLDGVDKRLDSMDKRFDGMDKRFDGIDQRLKGIPTRDELPSLIEKAFEHSTLKTEHNRMKKIIHEKLGVEV